MARVNCEFDATLIHFEPRQRRTMTKPAIVIPAYQPGRNLRDLVEELAQTGHPVVIVDDGSSGDSLAVFEDFSRNKSVAVVHHAINLGKGAALRTGINYALTNYPDSAGVVTADADGQHLPKDILRIASQLCASQDNLVLGVRTFDTDVPARSRWGNVLTRHLVHAVVGRKLRDSQTGLRGIPRALACDLLRLSAPGYEFELDMLVLGKHRAIPITEIPIATVYENGNACSHFQPIRDSLKIYFVLFRFALLSLITAVIDNVMFLVAFASFGQIAIAQATGRLVAVLFNYGAARRAVFLSSAPHRDTLWRYLLLVTVNGIASYAGITLLHTRFQWKVITSKICVEAALFVVNFALQRDFVFTRRGARERDTNPAPSASEQEAATALDRSF